MIIDGKKTAADLRSELKKKVAELKSESFGHVCKQTTDNAQTLFGWPCG